MKFNSLLIISFSVCISLFVSSCDFLFGTRKDATTADIFQQGSIDPNLYPSQVGYVPLLPFWKNIPHPVDVYVGYDEMVYVCDDNGLDIFDLKGTLQRNIPIPGASDVIQDRHLDTYVCGRVDKIVSGITYNLAAVYHISNASTASQPIIIDTLIHPFCDVSRNNSSFRGATDEAVKFTGLATRADNTIYVSRSGPTNDLSSVARPDNTILIFEEAQNSTPRQMKLLLTRIGYNSKFFISGDLEQTDRYKDKTHTGLWDAIKRFKDMEDVGVFEFGENDIVRNPLITKILKRYEE